MSTKCFVLYTVIKAIQKKATENPNELRKWLSQPYLVRDAGLANEKPQVLGVIDNAIKNGD